MNGAVLFLITARDYSGASLSLSLDASRSSFSVIPLSYYPKSSSLCCPNKAIFVHEALWVGPRHRFLPSLVAFQHDHHNYPHHRNNLPLLTRSLNWFLKIHGVLANATRFRELELPDPSIAAAISSFLSNSSAWISRQQSCQVIC